MYIAGLNIPFSHAQGIEAIVCLSTVAQISRLLRDQIRAQKAAHVNAGPVKPNSLPKSFVGRFVTPVHGLAMILPPVVYVGSVLTNKLAQPLWMHAYRFPYEIGVKAETWTRIAACVAVLGMGPVFNVILNHLGNGIHYIGIRQKPALVSSGPYSVVRHPLYTGAVAQGALLSVMYWSYLPLIAAGVVFAAFMVKIPIEEQLMLDDPVIGKDYAAYKKKVTYKLIPYVW